MTDEERKLNLTRHVEKLCNALNQHGIKQEFSGECIDWKIVDKLNPYLITFLGGICNNHRAFHYLKGNGYIDCGVCWRCGEEPIDNRYTFTDHLDKSIQFNICTSCYQERYPTKQIVSSVTILIKYLIGILVFTVILTGLSHYYEKLRNFLPYIVLFISTMLGIISVIHSLITFFISKFFHLSWVSIVAFATGIVTWLLVSFVWKLLLGQPMPLQAYFIGLMGLSVYRFLDKGLNDDGHWIVGKQQGGLFILAVVYSFIYLLAKYGN